MRIIAGGKCIVVPNEALRLYREDVFLASFTQKDCLLPLNGAFPA